MMAMLPDKVDVDLESLRGLLYSLYEFDDAGCRTRTERIDKAIELLESIQDDVVDYCG